ncbi:MAG: hypothetical protein ACP5SH_07510 [Syntrophobacteraceae bacterium]
MVKLPVAESVAEVPRLSTRFCRKVCRSALVEEEVVLLVLVVVADAAVDVLPEPFALSIAETRLLKSDCKVSRVVELVDDEVEEVEEVEEEEPSWEISASILVVRFA